MYAIMIWNGGLRDLEPLCAITDVNLKMFFSLWHATQSMIVLILYGWVPYVCICTDYKWTFLKIQQSWYTTCDLG